MHTAPCTTPMQEVHNEMSWGMICIHSTLIWRHLWCSLSERHTQLAPNCQYVEQRALCKLCGLAIAFETCCEWNRPNAFSISPIFVDLNWKCCVLHNTKNVITAGQYSSAYTPHRFKLCAPHGDYNARGLIFITCAWAPSYFPFVLDPLFRVSFRARCLREASGPVFLGKASGPGV